MEFYNNSIFWIEVEKIKPNPFQPRIEFDEARLNDLALSIRQYGVLQPLVVTRKEIELPDQGIVVEYELISGERRLRASKIAGLSQVPAIIKTGENDDKLKLELAIIENLQREDLNPVDRAKAFKKLADEFNLKHGEIGKKVGKSREYVSNSIRILLLPDDILLALSEGRISEGHTRPLLMLIDRKEEQGTLFKEILMKKMTVRETELIARKIAFEKARKFDRNLAPEISEFEDNLSKILGTRVSVERRLNGGKISIEFLNEGDLRNIWDYFQKSFDTSTLNTLSPEANITLSDATPLEVTSSSESPVETLKEEVSLLDDRSAEEVKQAEEDDSYNLNNFTI
ncbi:MAG: ParB protein [Patescibacteria group bacterium]|nr:ParB protein [Patescibacteria group bacterium]